MPGGVTATGKSEIRPIRKRDDPNIESTSLFCFSSDEHRDQKDLRNSSSMTAD